MSRAPTLKLQRKRKGHFVGRSVAMYRITFRAPTLKLRRKRKECFVLTKITVLKSTKRPDGTLVCRRRAFYPQSVPLEHTSVWMSNAWCWSLLSRAPTLKLQRKRKGHIVGRLDAMNRVTFRAPPLKLRRKRKERFVLAKRKRRIAKPHNEGS